MSRDRYAILSNLLDDRSVTYDVYDMDQESPEVVYEAFDLADAIEQRDSFNDQYNNDRTEQPLLYADDVDDSMDGDATSALASAGWGTDEDYGGYGDE